MSTLLPNVPIPEPLWTQDPVRYQIGRPIVVTGDLLDPTGQTVHADGDITWTALDGAGAQIATGATDGTTGSWSITLPAAANPDTLALTYSYDVDGATTTEVLPVEVVGSRLVTIPQLQADSQLTNLTVAQLEDLRSGTERMFEKALMYPPVPTGVRVEWWNQRPSFSSWPGIFLMGGQTFFGGAPGLLVPGVVRPLRWVNAIINQQQTDNPELIYADRTTGAFRYADGRPWLPGHYQLWAVHGMDRAPSDLARAAVIYCRYAARQSNLPERAASITSEMSTIVFAIATPDRPTGLPEVDSALVRWRYAGGVSI